MLTIVVSGATGLLGRSLVPLLKTSLVDCNIVGLGFSRCSNDIRKCDLTDLLAVDNLFSDLRPKIFVHCAAERRPDFVEAGSASAKAINIIATELLAKKCNEYNCILIYCGTDYIFDGTKPPYAEQDVPNPLNAYGLQKLEGEKVVLAASPRNVCLRLPMLYGPLDSRLGLDECSVTLLFKAVKGTTVPSKLDHTAVRFPTYTLDVAKVFVNVIHEVIRENSLICGIFHLSANESFTKYEMACRMASLFCLPSCHLLPDTTMKSDVRRPLNCQLSCRRLEELDLLVKMTPFDEGIKNTLLPFV